MNTPCRMMGGGILLIFLLGCASSPTDQARVDLTQRIEFDGISILPPQAENWEIGANPAGGIVFRKRFPESEPKTHTFLAGIGHADLHEQELRNQQDLVAYTKSTLSFENEARFEDATTHISLDENRSKYMHTDCTQYEFVTKESTNPQFPGTILVLTTYGFQCRHPYFDSLVINAFCTERYQENNLPVSNAYRNECNAFLNDVQFKPLDTRINGVMDATYLSVPVWDYPEWQKMISAAQMLNAQGNKNGAEQLCYEALHYADANTIKSLYAYADLLAAQRRNRNMLVRGRANKLMELRVKQVGATEGQATWLGFQPDEVLSEYADLLNRLHRATEEDSIRKLKQAYRYTQEIHAVRLRIMGQGGDARGICTGFQNKVR